MSWCCTKIKYILERNNCQSFRVYGVLILNDVNCFCVPKLWSLILYSVYLLLRILTASSHTAKIFSNFTSLIPYDFVARFYKKGTTEIIIKQNYYE